MPDPSPNPLRIGLLGASQVAQLAIFPSVAARQDVVVSAVAASSAQKAAAYAERFGIPAVAADYAALIARDDVDLVYVGLPPSDHCVWTTHALQAGKHVLCEKPFAMSAEEARRMVEAARHSDRWLIEAWHYRFHPLMRQVERVVASGALGRLRHVRAQFDVPTNPALNEFRWQAALGGGALMDNGSYTVHALRTLIGREPRVVEARAQRYDDIDLEMVATLDFGDGLSGEIECALAARDLYSELLLEGERGTLRVQGFPLPQFGCSFRLKTAEGIDESLPDGGTSYDAQMDHVLGVLAGREAALTGGEDAIAQMSAVEAIYRAAGFPR